MGTDGSPTKRTRINTGRTNRSGTPSGMGSPLLARKNQLLNPIKRSRSSTPGGFGKLSTRSGRSELRTPSLRADIKRQEHNSHQLKLGQQMVDERLHLQSDNWQDKYGDLDGKIDIADVTLQKEREANFQGGKSVQQLMARPEKESWVRSNEIDPDQYLGKAKKLGPEMGINRDDLSKIGTGTVPESARSVDSLGSVVGRGAQAEKLRVRFVEQGLRSKLLSMVPGKNELQKCFKLFDFDSDGKIDAQEFQRVFQRLNIPLEDDETRLLFDKYDKDGSGTVQYWEFVNQFLPPDTDYNWRDYSPMGRVGFARVHPDLRVHKMVDILSNEVGSIPGGLSKLYDKVVSYAEGPECIRNGEAALSHLQFTQGMEKAGFQLSSEQWMHMFLVADDDKSGMLDKEEFIGLFGTEEGKAVMLNGPGGETGECYDPFHNWRDELNAAPPVYMRTQLNIPGTTLPKPAGEAPKNPLDEDLTTCTDALAHLKLAFKHQRVSMDKFFEQFDEAPSNGWISRKELDEGLRKLGLDLSETEICHMVRCMGVKEYEEGITKGQFAQIVTDDTVDSYDNIRGDVNDGRSKSKMGQTLSMPKGIQPNDGDPIRTPRGSVDWITLDPEHRSSAHRSSILQPDAMSNTLGGARRTQQLPAHLRPNHTASEVIRSALDTISGWVEEKGVAGAFNRLDKNQNQYVTADDLAEVIPGLSTKDSKELSSFLDHNQDGAVSLKDFSATVREISKSLPQLAPKGDFTRLGSTMGSSLKSIPSKTRYCHDWSTDYKTQVPHRYTGRRRAHDHNDGVVGTSTQGVAGAIVPRCDSPAFMSSKDRHVLKAPAWEVGTMGKVHGWQQDMIRSDKESRQALSGGRQSRLHMFQGRAAATFTRESNRADMRASATQDLKRLQKTRYMRTVCAEGYE